MTGISIFDVDRTITRRPTYSLFLLFAARRLAPWRLALVPLLVPVALAYAVKAIDRKAMKQAMHRVVLGSRLPQATALQVAEDFAHALHKDGLLPQACARLAQERAEGRTLVLATAAPELYIRPLARLLGIEHVAASAGVWRDACLTHRIDGPNCYGPAKLEMIRTLFDRAGLDRAGAHVRFFSDHASDVHVGDWADETVAVNASSGMIELAGRRGWQVIDWRGA